MSNLKRPDCFEFAMDFLGKPEEPAIRAYVEQLEAKVAEVEKCEPVGWQFYQDGKWHNGMDTNNHKKNTIDAGIPIRELYTSPQPIEKCEPVLKVHHGEICYKSQSDDQSYGMWCPVNFDTAHTFKEGTQFYTSPQPIETCEPVAYMYQHEETGNIGFIDQWQVDNGFEKNNPRLKIITSLYTSPQPIEKSEPVAQELHERNRLGYAVVDVIGALDEIIENAQEVEVDDFLHIAIPIDKWHELQDALEEMPKRAELYTSQISKED